MANDFLLRPPPTDAPAPAGPLRPGDEVPSTPSVRRRRVRPIIAALVVVVIAAAIAGAATQSVAWWRNQFALSFTHRPTDFAELYFTSPSALPSRYDPKVPLVVSIGVGNVGSSAHDFTVIATALQRGGTTQRVAAQPVSVGAQGSASNQLSLLLPPGTTELDLTLAGHPRTSLALHLTQRGHHAS